jgi:ABC-type branched-subunit amino acid transport system permease subunit
VSIGVDQWVETADSRRVEQGGWWGRGSRWWGSLPPWGRMGIVLGLAVFVPVFASDFVVRVGVNALLLALLAVGLNISVGWAGLLDLGFIAFYGFGAYAFAILSSDQLGIDLPTLVAVPLVVVATGLLGVLLGLPSRRLSGDYLAIVTLFFSQIFLELALNVDRLGVDLTGGPNGIAGVTPFHLFGMRFSSPASYFYLFLTVLTLVVGALYFLERSRTGRAWRAIHDDALAAEIMTVPINRLKLVAFASGAAIAGLAGSMFASFQLGVYPLNFQVQFLIVVYAALILGGSGSLSGAVLGGVVVAVMLDLLRDPGQASAAFYGVIAVTLIAKIRPWKRLGAIVGGAVVLGFVVNAIATPIWPGTFEGEVESTGPLASFLDSWIVVPTDPVTPGNWAYCALIACVLALPLLRGWRRDALVVPTLYLAAFVWETRLVGEPSITRQLLLGALLVVMMLARPQGLIGRARVERV